MSVQKSPYAGSPHHQSQAFRKPPMGRQASASLHQNRRASIGTVSKQDTQKGQHRPVRQQATSHVTSFSRAHVQSAKTRGRQGATQVPEQSKDSQLMITSARIVRKPLVCLLCVQSKCLNSNLTDVIEDLMTFSRFHLLDPLHQRQLKTRKQHVEPPPGLPVGATHRPME